MKTKVAKKVTQIVEGSIWLEKNGIKYFGPGPYELLERIEVTGSISEAAKQMKLSYKKAWEIVNRLNEMEGIPIVSTQTGGSKGGGSFISDEAKLLMKKYASIREKFKLFLQDQTNSIN